MKKRWISFIAFLLISVISAQRIVSSDQETKKECCFVRTGYQGTCRVTPGEGETCASILKYLNTPGTVGKTYCGSSKLRGGWKLASCPAKQ